jgi:hypothetical protein
MKISSKKNIFEDKKLQGPKLIDKIGPWSAGG